jgi:hypothetical protein
MRYALVLILILAIPKLGWAEVYTSGNELYQQLSRWQKTSTGTGSVQDMVPGSIGIGYVIGVVDSFENCIPQHVSRGQVIDIAFRYLDAHPEERQFSASSVVKVAVAEKFPCPKGK